MTWQRLPYYEPTLVGAGPAWAIVGRAWRRIAPAYILRDTWAPMGQSWEIPVVVDGVPRSLALGRLFPSRREAEALVARLAGERHNGWLHNSYRNDVRADEARKERARKHAERTGCDCCCYDCCTH